VSGDLPVDWPGEETINLLVLRAHGLFIYAATVCRFIEESGEQWPPHDLLLLVLSDDSKPGEIVATQESPAKELDQIYTQILEHSFKKVHERGKQQLAKVFRQVVGAIVILFDPLSTTALAGLLAVRKEIINMRLRHLCSVLNVPENEDSTIRLLHPSFRDFLLDKQRCRDQHFWVDEKKAHEALAENCLRLMFNCLRRDICGLHAPGTFANAVESSRIEQYLPPDLQYACRYWVQHFQRSEARLVDDCQIHEFLQKHFLHWLEALGLIGKTSEGVLMVKVLQSMIKVSILINTLYIDGR
jgi:hypothetical protein